MANCTVCNPIIPATQVRWIKGIIYCDACGRTVSERELYLAKQMGPAPQMPNNSFERGIRRDSRGVPYLDHEGKPRRLGEYFDPRQHGESPITIPGGIN